MSEAILQCSEGNLAVVNKCHCAFPACTSIVACTALWRTGCNQALLQLCDRSGGGGKVAMWRRRHAAQPEASECPAAFPQVRNGAARC